MYDLLLFCHFAGRIQLQWNVPIGCTNVGINKLTVDMVGLNHEIYLCMLVGCVHDTDNWNNRLENELM